VMYEIFGIYLVMLNKYNRVLLTFLGASVVSGKRNLRCSSR